ncbi:MarR family winged helix-turn-helix transcriptional regulator [Micromonospora rhizosphaerae]|uniref:MarR family winged helix-turn-helix transcriptional regulator n=1 Tax=Micromonospora rhizosphaerae TaxID=568872 RepID=UPI001C402196|nr:MarR family winged helix-turn-helix transcriptional regulator [Micromonospora rhizosphaerae]
MDSGISESDFEMLAALAGAPDHAMRARTLRAELQWEKSRLAHQIRRMEQRGLVVREACLEDGRAPTVRLTDAGLAGIRSAAPAHAARLRELFFDALTGPGRRPARGEQGGAGPAAPNLPGRGAMTTAPGSGWSREPRPAAADGSSRRALGPVFKESQPLQERGDGDRGLARGRCLVVADGGCGTA